MLIDLHVKTDRSPGIKGTIKDTLKRAKKAQLDGVLFADVLATSHCDEILKEAKAQGVNAFIGVEIPTDKGILVGVVPNIDEFYKHELWQSLTEYTTPTAESVIALFHEHDGAIIASRPYDREVPYPMGDHVFTLKGLHAVEVMTCSTTTHQDDFALEAARNLGIGTVGGSDQEKGKGKVGKCATFFNKDITSQKELVDALRDGEFWAIRLEKPGQPREKPPERSPKSDSGDKRRGGGGGGRSGGGRSGGGGRGRKRD